MKALYPSIEANKTGFLDVGSGHCLYWEESGNPKGIPILFLHGGPGSGSQEKHRRYFHPESYRIIIFDQRGSGKSTPHAEIRNNTTWDLVQDIEKLRKMLGIESFIVFGGSWGSTLALAYAIMHPEHVKGLILRGIFLGTKREIDWFLQTGAKLISADAWEKFEEIIPLEERGDMLLAYHKRLTSSDLEVRRKAARAWALWESVNLRLIVDPELLHAFSEEKFAEAHSCVEVHYFVNRCFFKTDNWLLENVAKIRHIPGIIIHGRYDLVCPFSSAWELHKAWPEATLEIIPDAGHSASEIGIQDALVRAADAFMRKG